VSDRFRYAWPCAQRPQQIHGGLPGIWCQFGYDVEIEGHARPAVESGGHSTNDDEINVVVVQLIQNLEESARHATAVP